MAAAALITILTACIIEIIKTKISKEIMTQANLEIYEKWLDDYLSTKKISRDDLLDICKGQKKDDDGAPLRINIEEIPLLDKKLKGGEAVIDNDGEGGYTVYVADNLSTKSNRFAIAHEIGHVVMGDPLPVGRKGHGLFIRSKDEQIRDYIAAAILLPMEEFSNLIEQANYELLDKKGKMKFIETLSDEREVDREVIMKRIIEYKTIKGKAV